MSTKKNTAAKPAAKVKDSKKPSAAKEVKAAKSARPTAKKVAKPVAKKAAKSVAKAEKAVAKKVAKKTEKKPAEVIPLEIKPTKTKKADKADKADKPKKKRGRKAAVKEVIEPNKHLDFVFSIAEQMKKAQREESEASDSRYASVKLSRRPDTRVKGKNTQKFPAADLAQFKKTLLMMRQTALGQSASLRDIALEQSEERGGEDEDGSDAFLRLQNLSHVDSQNRIVRQIDEAMARIANGTYGVCENCGQLIRKPRLLNLPFVRTCMECQIRLEQR